MISPAQHIIWFPVCTIKTSETLQTIILLLRQDNQVRRIAVTDVPISVRTTQDMESVILKPENISTLWDKATPVSATHPSIAALISLNCLDFMRYGRKES